MRSPVSCTLPGLALRISGTWMRRLSTTGSAPARAGYETVTAAPSGNAGPLSRTTTPLCTRPGMTMHSLFVAQWMESSAMQVTTFHPQRRHVAPALVQSPQAGGAGEGQRLVHFHAGQAAVQHYGTLSVAQIYAALAYYYDHQAEFDAEIERQAGEYEALRSGSLDSPGRQRLRAQGKLP